MEVFPSIEPQGDDGGGAVDSKVSVVVLLNPGPGEECYLYGPRNCTDKDAAQCYSYTEVRVVESRGLGKAVQVDTILTPR